MTCNLYLAIKRELWPIWWVWMSAILVFPEAIRICKGRPLGEPQIHAVLRANRNLMTKGATTAASCSLKWANKRDLIMIHFSLWLVVSNHLPLHSKNISKTELCPPVIKYFSRIEMWTRRKLRLYSCRIKCNRNEHSLRYEFRTIVGIWLRIARETKARVIPRRTKRPEGLLPKYRTQ